MLDKNLTTDKKGEQKDVDQETAGLSLSLKLDKKLSQEAFTKLAKTLEASEILPLADGVIKIAVAKMAGAVREVSVHRGFDPRNFALLGFGGAGPMHV